MNPPRYRLLWALTLSSLVLNLTLVALVGSAITQGAELREHVLGQLRTLPLEPVPLSLQVEVDQQLPIALDVPFKETLTVPIDMMLPLDATVTVPVDIPVIKQQVQLKVPIRATIPVNTSVVVEVDKQIPVRATLPIQMQVPVSLSLDLAPFRDRVTAAVEQMDWGM